MVNCPAVDTLLDQMFTNFFEEILQRTHPHSAAVCELELAKKITFKENAMKIICAIESF